MSVESESTGEQDLQVAAAPNGVEQTQTADERVVPLSALEAERAKRQNLEDENKMMKEHYALINSKSAQEAPKNDFGGLEDSDVMTVGDFKKMSGDITNGFSATLEEIKFSQNNSDYQEVVAKHLPQVLKTNPKLRSTLEKTQDFEMAYYLAKNSDSYRQENVSAQINSDAERIVKNSKTAGSLSSLGSSSPVSQTKRYNDMSDDEFSKLTRQNLGY